MGQNVGDAGCGVLIEEAEDHVLLLGSEIVDGTAAGKEFLEVFADAHGRVVEVLTYVEGFVFSGGVGLRWRTRFFW